MKVTIDSGYLHLLLIFLPRRVTSVSCQEGLTNPLYPNCTEANSAFCAGDEPGDDIILRCFYPYGKACPGNCQDK